MSKELIERLRADAESTDDIGLCADAADRIEELERDLLNLVCRIHRDGGHYIAKHGEAKAIADADIVAAQNNADLDTLQADRDEWKARAEFSYKQRDELEREVASRDAEVAKLKDDNEYLYVAAIERDQLRAKINVLREALSSAESALDESRDYPVTYDEVITALITTPEQSLAAYRNKVIEECAERIDFNAPISAAVLRAMKEKP